MSSEIPLTPTPPHRAGPPSSPATSDSRWARAASDAGEDGRQALSELAASFYYCVYAWWRRAGREAEDATTATLASFGQWLDAAPPRRTDSGSERMRTWLLERLAELSSETLEAPAAPPIAFDPAWAESRYPDEPPGDADAIFQRRWALTVLEFTVATMRAEYTARGEEALFPELLPFAGFDSGEEDRYAAAAQQAGRTIGAMHKEVYDFRHRQRELLHFFTGDTLLDPADTQSEITALLCACDAPGPEAATARLPTEIGNLHPDEMLSRAMQSVRMTGGGANGWEPPTFTEAARLFPQYEVCALLGRGGMGAVYQGRQVELDRLVAIKLLPLEVSVNRDFADRFRREARAMAKLQHPNIIDVHDFGTTSEGHLYFVMEYVDGANLDAMIRGPGLEPAQALEIIGGVCDALAYAHAEGVVHRDIKPANVMVSKKGRVKVADFGLARLADAEAEQLGHTVTGTVMGTPDYMAPEQKRGMAVDHRADIYSLGVMLYEMLCREVPQGIFDPPSKRVAVDTRVDQVVIKAMQQQPDRRYQSTQEMKADVDAAGAPQPKALALARLPLGGMSRAVTMITDAVVPRSTPAPRSRKPLFFASLGVLALGGALFFLQPRKQQPSAPANKAPATAPGQAERWQNLFAGTALIDSVWVKSRATQASPSLKLRPEGNVLTPGKYRNGAVRLRAIFTGEGGCALAVRERGWQERYGARVESAQTVSVYLLHEANTQQLRSIPLPQPLTVGREYQLELRLVGSRLSVSLDGALLATLDDTTHVEPGRFGMGNYTGKEQTIQSLEFLNLDPPAATENALGPWQPLLTDAEWKQTVPGQREVVDGRMHLQNDVRALKPQPVADGAIRARIQFREGSKTLGIQARSSTTDNRKYKIEVGQTYADLYCYTPKGFPLARYTLPKPLQPGDTVLVELRLQGDRLTALVDGAVVIEARDSRVTAPGQWGVLADDGWFESVEVQSPAPAASVGWEDLFAQLTPEIVAQTGHGWTLKDGELFSPDTKPYATLPLPGQLSGISYRVRVKLRQLPSEDVFHIVLPVADRMCGFELEGWGGNYSGLGIVNGKQTKDTPGVVVGKQVKDSAPHDLEVTVRLDGANATITTTLDTRPLYAWTGPTAALSQDPYWATAAPGALALGTFTGGWAVSEVKVKRLGASALRAEDSAHRADATPATATQDAPFANTLGMKFVPVPIVGGPTAGKTVLFSVWDTRVQDYEAFATETRREWQKPSFEQGPTHPAVLITWDDAIAFCAWLTERERKSGRIGPQAVYRLPSDHEWSCAAGIGDQEDATKLPSEKNGKLPGVYPWGSAWPPPKGAGNYARLEGPGKPDSDGFVATSPVGSFAANQFGLYDMSGNVWQWCEDWYDTSQQSHVVRGGSWNNENPDKLLTSTRAPYTKAGTAHSIRPVLVLPAASPSAVASATATKAAPFVNSLGMKFLPVPIVGGPTSGKTVLFSVWETRVQDYEVFAAETRRGSSKAEFAQEPTHPVVKMTWEDATAFCAWLTARESRDRGTGRLPPGWAYRLPSDHEWSCAVGIGEREDPAAAPMSKSRKIADLYPWGTTPPEQARAANFCGEEGEEPLTLRGYRDPFVFTAPVGSFAANALGLFDLAGNAREWCLDLDTANPTRHILRSGSYNDANPDAFLSSSRTSSESIKRIRFIGFRCVLEVSAPVPSSAAAAVGWEDLLAQLTPERLKQNGDGWSREGDVLRSPARKFALLPLTDRYAGTSYQFRVKLRQLRPTEGIAIVLPAADRMVGFALDGWPSTGFYTSLNLVNGQFGEGLPGSIKGQQIRDSEPHELEVTVRLEGANLDFNAALDGRPLYSWRGPIAALSQSDSWRKTPPGTLAFGTMADIWVVSEVKAKRLDSGASAPPAAATKTAPFVNSLGMKFVPVPGTDVLFCIHETRKQDYAAYARGDAAAAEKAKEHALKFGAGTPNDPLPYATWDDAQAFCAWLSRTEGRTYRLPTDREWSYAVGIGDQEKWNADTTPATVNEVPNQFPWGTEWPPPKGAGNYRDVTYNTTNSNADGNYIQDYDDGFNTYAPVMSFTPNRLGLYDLGGNAWEWVADWYDASKSKHTLRGADYFAKDPDRLLSSRRYAPNPSNPGYGFRVVLVPPAPALAAPP